VTTSALLLLGACRSWDERVAAAVDGARDRMQGARRTLQNAVAVLPKPNEMGERGCVKGASVVPVVADFRPNTSRPGNMDVMMVDDVAAPWEPSRAMYPVARAARLGRLMGFTDGAVPPPADAWASDVERAVAAGLAVRYVLLFRVAACTLPRALTTSEFTGGEIEGDVFLVDLEASTVVCVLPFVGKSDESLYYFRPQAREPEARLREFEKALLENLYAAARRDAFQRLETLVPGSRILSY
jgi:hypothetical protein